MLDYRTRPFVVIYIQLLVSVYYKSNGRELVTHFYT